MTAAADVSIVKTGPATVVAGGSVTYSLVVANAGPSDATGLSVSDALPAGVTFVSATGTGWTCTNVASTSVTCTLPTLATGTTAPTITVVVTAPAQAATLSNTATVSTTSSDPNPANNTSSIPTTVTASANLSLVKTGSPAVSAGAPITYTLDVANAGPSDAANVSVTDTLPAGVTFGSASGTGWVCTNVGNTSVTCTRPTLAPGPAPAITIVVTAPTAPGTLTNSATVSSPTPDPDPTDNTSTVDTSVGPNADLSLVKSGPATVTAGGNVTYSLVVANAGPSDAVGVSVSDTLPLGVTFVSAGGTGWACSNAGNVSVTCTAATVVSGTTASAISVVVTAPVQAGLLTNSAAVSATTPDPDPTNDSDTADTTVSGVADLSLVKSGPASVTSGGVVTYSLAVSNAGPSDATTVSVTDTLPSGVTYVSAAGTGWTCSHAGNVSVTCTRVTVATGSPAPVITVMVTAPVGTATLTNAASVSAATSDPDPSDNSDAATTTVGAAADLSLVKTGPATVTAGDTITYTLIASNAGPDDADAVQVVDTLPPGVTFVSAAGPGWTCTNTGNVSVTCTRPTLATGTSAPEITLVVRAPNAVGTVDNHASVSAATFDPVGNNNAAVAATGVLASETGTGGGELPHTGADLLGLIGLGFVLVMVGAALRRVRRGPTV